MTRAKITRHGGYKCAPNGHTVKTIPLGTIVDGKVAAWALADLAASAMFNPVKETKITPPPETKRKRPRKAK